MTPYVKRIMIDVCLIAAFFIGILFCYLVFLDFAISLFHFESKLNISSIAYCVERLLFVIFPLILFSTRLFTAKEEIIKVMLYAIAICFFASNVWVIYYIIKNPISDLGYASVPVWLVSGSSESIVNSAAHLLEVFQTSDAYVFSYITWDSYDLFNILFSTIIGVLYIRLAVSLNDSNPKKTTTLYLIITLLMVVLPLLYNLLVKGSFMLSEDWVKRNVLLVFESILIFIAMRTAATSESYWDDMIYLYR